MVCASNVVSGRRGIIWALAVLLLLAQPPGARAITGLTETMKSGNKLISLLTDGVPDMIAKADSRVVDDSQMMADSPFKYNHLRDLSPG